MKQYIIVTACSSDVMSELVSEKLNQGWEIAGNLIVIPEGFIFNYLQPMTRV